MLALHYIKHLFSINWGSARRRHRKCRYSVWCPRCDPAPRHSHKSTAADLRNTIHSEIKSQSPAESIFPQRHKDSCCCCCCCRALPAVFLSSPPLLLMLLIMIFHQQDRFRQPSSETLPLISPQKTRGSPTIFTDCKHSLLLIISPVLSILLLLFLLSQSTCVYTRIHKHTPPLRA